MVNVVKMIDIKKNYIFIRLKNPKKYIDFRTKDVGRPGHNMIVLGKLPSGKWEAQALRVSIIDVANNDKITMDFLKKFKIKPSKVKSALMKHIKKEAYTPKLYPKRSKYYIE